MIQRKQTLFLVLGALLAGSMYALPLVRYTRGAEAFLLRATGVVDGLGADVPGVSLKFPLHVIAGLLLVLLVVVALFYKDRARQRRLLRFGYIFALGLFVAEVFTHISLRAYLALGGAVDHGFRPAFFVPLVILGLCYLADRGIKADEELIRSMDRLR